MNPFHRRLPGRSKSLARIASTAALAAILSIISMGFQGCIENPGPDGRLDQVKREYRLVASVSYGEETVLDLSVKRESGEVGLRILSTARERIDSASFLLQFVDQAWYLGPRVYYRDTKLQVIIRIADLEPGAVREYEFIAEDFGLDGTFNSARMIRFAAGDTRGHPLGGVYSGNYSLMDTAGRSGTGPSEGIITADGEYQFLMERGSSSGRITDDLLGRLDSTGAEAVLRAASHGGSTFSAAPSAPFSLASGILTGSFVSPETVSWFDSLGFVLGPMRFPVSGIDVDIYIPPDPPPSP